MHLIRSCVGFKVLEYFLVHSSSELYLKELSRMLGISPSSTKIYCDALIEDGTILEAKKGNLRLFRLNRDNFAVKEMVKAHYLTLLKEMGIENLAEGSISLAIYGSFASGNVDEKSDLDLLVVGDENAVSRDRILSLQEKLGKEVQLTVLPYFKWEKLKRDGDKFAQSVLRNHVLVKGAEL